VAARAAAGPAGGGGDAGALLIFALAHCPEVQVGARLPARLTGRVSMPRVAAGSQPRYVTCCAETLGGSCDAVNVPRVW